MLRIVEAFSGIGSQSKALKKATIKFEVINTIEWDTAAILAYDLIHNGPQTFTYYDEKSKGELVEIISKYPLSNDGKKRMSELSFKGMSIELIRSILYAIDRSKNLVDIKNVHGQDLASDIDILTYSFPCQDLSIGGFWHGNRSGIKRSAHNRSGMLWEIERILKEMKEQKLNLPKFLLMENVYTILSKEHRVDFEEWKQYLSALGYSNQVFTLNAKDFGIPQNRKRTFMISAFHGGFRNRQIMINQYFKENNLENISIKNELLPIKHFIRDDYSIDKYALEANTSNPNNTPSRRKIKNMNGFIELDNEDFVIKTITTKQDRHPNSGLIDYQTTDPTKIDYRNLTPRECFLLMGFDEKDFDTLIDANIEYKKNLPFFTHGKLIKLAGNSIVVNVLTEIFQKINDLNIILNNEED